ncbi:SusC/RagA family TonB-linked outer membrane protein [Pedobacter borealis]|uniref:SusC/RagA family TonB-linked outer membrane protein n=1 Tax=Pedobacter borealis TaxID=475254 RepID=UPI00068F70C4|nr:SusC/RagA family TonB-linked outer membrane protein [Pedobacter borealis]
MKLIIVLLTATFLQVSAGTYAQNVTLKEKNVKLVAIFKEIRKQTGYDFIYSDRMLENIAPVNLNLTNVPLVEALNKAFENQPLLYEIENKTIVVKAKSPPTFSFVNQIRVITGTVTDENGDPLVGVSVRSKKIGTLVRTDKDGKYAISINDNADELIFSFIGLESKTLRVPEKNILNVQLKSLVNKLDNIVITGTGIDRKKESFTGATSTFSGAELKAIGNNNIIASLKSMDPSFLVLDNEKLGSNPNLLPTIELRGKTTVGELSLKDQFGTDPNQPLFILDGFESTLQTIIDLDMNRVASVTILKDAASTALYGSKAANGVIVIETVRPVPGKLRFSYTSDLRVEGPDLTVYNMMNAAEKLEFERLSGRYVMASSDPTLQAGLDSIYYRNKAAVARGVDTYWLAEPLQNIISQNHSINASGGDEVFRYSVGFNYKLNPGVMKGSTRDTWGGNVNFIYRKSKININNSFSINGNSHSESPYGNFADYVNANPYYIKSISNPFLDQTSTLANGGTITTGLNVPNPLYNASLPFRSNGTGMNLTNNLSVQYDILPKFRVNGGFSISKGVLESDDFLSPDHTSQLSQQPNLRGKYTYGKSNNYSIRTNFLLTYGNLFGKKHAVNVNVRGDLGHNYSNSATFVSQGFPTGSDPILGFAYGYENSGLPRSSTSTYRSASATASANYAYDSRYLFDASYRIDGSTSFGKNDPWSPYWSTGIGWNVHKESFLKNSNVISRIKLYSNIGVTGNQVMGGQVSTTVYQYLRAYNQVGQGINVLTLANNDLVPSKTTQLSHGIDFGLFHDRLTGSLNAYSKITDNQIVSVDYPTSSGISSYQFNVGKLSTIGYEIRLNYAIINNREQRILWRIGVTGASNDSKYSGFGNTLKKLDAKQVTDKALTRFRDGASPNDIFAVRSLGIDPASGREIYLTATGEHTLDWSLADQPKVGSSKPLMEGMISSTFSYRNLSLSLSMRYRAKAYVFNQALLDKVENIDYNEVGNNQDKRALYDRWKKPGDIAQFKNINLMDPLQPASATQMSTRFLQEENSLSLESINMSYTFVNAKWMKSLGLQNLNLSGYTNDIFRFSTVKRERGINYPFARSVSFTIRASF